MSEEIEDGELNSDIEENDNQNMSPLSSNINGTKDVSPTGALENDDSSKDTNPYDQEDEIILQLKIKALQSLLETQTPASASATFSKKKKSTDKMPVRKQQVTSNFFNRHLKTQSFKSKRGKQATQKFKKKNKPKFNIINQKTKFPTRNATSQPNMYTYSQDLSKDNYDVQDMDIEPTSNCPVYPPQQPSPLSCLTNLNNDPVNAANFFNYLNQQNAFANPEFYFNQNLQMLQQQPFYQVLNQMPPHHQTMLLPSLLPSLLAIPPHTGISPVTNNPFNPQNKASMINYSPLTLEQQQNELNDLIEARYQQEQQNQRNTYQNTSNLKKIEIHDSHNRSHKPTFIMNNIEIDLTKDDSVKFTLSPNSTSSTSDSVTLLSPVQARRDVDERYIATSCSDIDYRNTTASSNGIEVVTKEVDAILSTFNERIQSADIDSHEKEKILKANLLQKLLKIKTSKTELSSPDLEVPKEAKVVEPPIKETVIKDDPVVVEEPIEDTEEEMNQLRMKLLANLNKKRQKQKLNQQAQQDKQEKQMDKDMFLLKRKLQEHELMIVEKSQTSSTSNVNPDDTKVIGPNRKINPVIIRLNQTDSDDEEEYIDSSTTTGPDNYSEPIVTVPAFNLQDNISQFLKEAKNQAERIALHSLLPNNEFSNRSDPTRSEVDVKDPEKSITSTPAPVRSVTLTMTKDIPAPPATTVSSNQPDSDKVAFIKSLRDKINQETKQINSLQKTVSNFKQIESKKSKETEATKLKISSLREQLLAAEKILKINQESALTAKQQCVLFDAKLEQLQNTKRVRQQFLQKVLGSFTKDVAVNKNVNSVPSKLNTSSSAPVVQALVSSTTAKQTLTPKKRASPDLTVDQPPNKTKKASSPQALAPAVPKVQSPVKEGSPSLLTMSLGQPPLPSEPPPPIPKSPPLPIDPPPPLPSSDSPEPTTKSPPPSLPQDAVTKKSSPVSRKSTFSLKTLPPMTLGGVVAATALSSNKSNPYALSNIQKNASKKTTSYSSTIRPNLFISKQTDQKLEQLAKNSSILQPTNSTKKLVNVQIQSNMKKNLKAMETSAEKKQDLQHRQKLTECLDELVKSTSSHCESLDIWAYESISPVTFKEAKSLVFKAKNSEPTAMNLTSMNANFKAGKDIALSDAFGKSDICGIYPIEDVTSYESPLKVFRGYRFSSNFCKVNQLDEAYSKFYCNAIDFRKPFCPFDMHGSCKDSNCTYQHLNVMTMDNLQRTEHLLSYCPQLLDLSSQNPSPKEAIKKLKSYAKQFMNTNLNKMSIKDYFKHLYDQVQSNIKLDPPNSTILSRAPALCFNHNKSLGVHESDVSTETSSPKPSSIDDIENLLEKILSVNMNRSLDIKLKHANAASKLDLNWLNQEQETPEYFQSNELILAWLFYGKLVYSENKQTDSNLKSLSASSSLQMLLNILSNALESNSNCELFWLVYLNAYMRQKNSLKDYHEICLLCLDNLITYDLIWFMLNTCPAEYLNLVIELYEKFLIGVTTVEQLQEFEQSNSTTIVSKCSFYLMELIFYDVNLKLINGQTHNEAKELLSKYLHRPEIVAKLEPNDLCLVWLCAIHLEAFSSLPNMIRFSVILNSRVLKYFDAKSFWHMQTENKRVFNHNFFNYLTTAYTSIEKAQKSVDNKGQRHIDSFLLPWNFNYACSIEKIQSLFYESLKAINNRLALIGNSSNNKQLARLISIPLFINLITLEISNKRQEVAGKLCERLLKSSDAEILKELWVSQIYIYRSQNSESMNNSIENTIRCALKIFPMDAQITFVSAQYYSSINQKNRSIELIEILVESYFFDDDSQSDNKFEISTLFRKLLQLPIETVGKEATDPDIANVQPLSKIIHNIDSQLICICVCYCYYMQLKENVFSPKFISETYETLIRKFKLQSHRSILWTRYFKYISSLKSIESDVILDLIKKCIQDLTQVSTDHASCSTDLFVPFYYNSPIKISSLWNLSYYDNNFIKNGFVNKTGPYYYSNKESNDEIFINDNCHSDSQDYYYLNCLIDLWLKLYTRTVSEKFQLAKYLMELMPYNSNSVRLFITFGSKVQGSKVTLQCVYDHLNLNAITNENIWILCIKLCMDLNDLQQAVLMYQRAEAVCTREKTSVIALKKLATLLFPTQETLTTGSC